MRLAMSSYVDQVQYKSNKPPIMPVSRQVEFECVECHKLGTGPPGSKVHPGGCRAAHDLAIAKRSVARTKRRKLMARELAAMPIRLGEPREAVL